MTGVLNEKLNVDQYKNSILYFVKYCNNQYLGKTKLNKLLYYLDFIYFRDHKSSVTGDVYLHKDYGPVPANIDEIIASLKNEGVLSVETVPHKDGEKVKFSFGENASYTDSAFNSEQKKLLKNICDEFGSWSTDKIVSQTHLEAPWFFSKPFDIVDYSYSKDIEFFVK